MQPTRISDKRMARPMRAISIALTLLACGNDRLREVKCGECLPGATRCSSAGTQQVCADHSGNGCASWGGDRSCPCTGIACRPECYPFTVELPVGTIATRLTFWHSTGHATSEISVGPDGGVFPSPAETCSATLEYPGREASYDTAPRLFPAGAPPGIGHLTFPGKGHVGLCVLPTGDANWGVAHDGACRYDECRAEMAAGKAACLSPSGLLLVNTAAARIDQRPLSDEDIAAGKYRMYVWFDYGAPTGFDGWWYSAPMMPFAPGVAYFVVPQSLPGGLCPLRSGSHRHPLRLSAPQLVGAPHDDPSGYVQMSPRAEDYQFGLAAALPDQSSGFLPYASMAVFRDLLTGAWLPAAAAARQDMQGTQADCSP